MELKPNPSLEARDVSFAYGAEPVVGGISLRVQSGEILGIIGPNGSGKSTLLKLLAGMLEPRTGSVWLDDQILSGLKRVEAARQIAVVPQEGLVPFPFTVAEIVLMGRAPRLRTFALESEHDRAVADAVMLRLGIADLAGRTIQELSGGERQRVMFARALAQEAPILLLDEPAAFLDLHHQMAMYEILSQLRGEGRAIATVLHDLNLAALYCDRIAILKNGHLVAVGAPAEVVSSQMIRQVFDADCRVDADPTTGVPFVLPRRG